MENWRKRSSRCIHGLTVTCCIILMIASIGLIAWISYLLVNSGTVYPSKETLKWQALLKHLLFINCVLIIMAGIGIMATVKNEAGILMLCVVLGFGALFGVLAYCTSQLVYLKRAAGATSALVIQNNVKAYFGNGDQNYCSDDVKLPEWLDYIQLHGLSCCGIISYQDWQIFWPKCTTRIPKSCCRKIADCPTNMNSVTFPNTPGTYIKNDSGCGSAVIQHMHHKFQLTLYSLVLHLVVVILTFVTFLVKFLQSCCSVHRKKYVLNGPHGHGSIQYSAAFIVGIWYRIKYGVAKRASSVRSRVSRRFQQPEDLSTGDSINNLPATGNYAYPLEEGERMAKSSDGSLDLQAETEIRKPSKSNKRPARIHKTRNFNTREVVVDVPLDEPSDRLVISEEPSVETIIEDLPPRWTREDRKRPTLKQLLKFGRPARNNKGLDSENDADGDDTST